MGLGIFAGCRHDQLVLARVVPAWLLDVYMLAGVESKDRRGRVPVIRSSNRNGVDIPVVEHPPEISYGLRRFRLQRSDHSHRFRENVRIDVAEITNGSIGA